MSSKNRRPANTTFSSGTRRTLRLRAEAAFHGNTVLSLENFETISPETTQRLLHELSLHQIELEMQNDELRCAQAELDASRTRYVDLYDFAPVGYFTVSKTGRILQTNLTAATLLGVERWALVKQQISHFIFPEDQDIYHRFRKKLFELGEPQVCELRMLKNDGTQFWANLASTATQDADGASALRIVLSDITERKHLEEALVSLEEERQRSIGQELHDNLGQQIAAIGYQAKALEKIILASGSVDAAKIVASIATQAQNAVMQCKQLAQGLLPFEMEENGLVAALQALASRISITYWISCDFVCKNEVVIDDINLALNFYRIAQEAIHNAIRHGHAKHLTIFLSFEGESIRLSICDDGYGFAGTEAKRGSTPGMGIKIMQYRAKQFGATLEFLLRAEGGTEVRVEILTA
jgi:PAS domain S-box-containing protein